MLSFRFSLLIVLLFSLNYTVNGQDTRDSSQIKIEFYYILNHTTSLPENSGSQIYFNQGGGGKILFRCSGSKGALVIGAELSNVRYHFDNGVVPQDWNLGHSFTKDYNTSIKGNLLTIPLGIRFPLISRHRSKFFLESGLLLNILSNVTESGLYTAGSNFGGANSFGQGSYHNKLHFKQTYGLYAQVGYSYSLSTRFSLFVAIDYKVNVKATETQDNENPYKFYLDCADANFGLRF